MYVMSYVIQRWGVIARWRVTRARGHVVISMRNIRTKLTCWPFSCSNRNSNRRQRTHLLCTVCGGSVRNGHEKLPPRHALSFPMYVLCTVLEALRLYTCSCRVPPLNSVLRDISKQHICFVIAVLVFSFVLRNQVLPCTRTAVQVVVDYTAVILRRKSRLSDADANVWSDGVSPGRDVGAVRLCDRSLDDLHRVVMLVRLNQPLPITSFLRAMSVRRVAN